MATYLLFLLLTPIATYFPERALYVLASVAGLLGYAAGREARAAVLRNLAIAVPQTSAAERRRIAMRIFLHGALGYVELLGIRRMKPGEVSARYRFDGTDYLRDALSAGQGVLLVGAHVGPTSVAAQLLAEIGVPTTVVVEPLRPPPLFRLVSSLRGLRGVRFAEVGTSAVRAILSGLRSREVVGFLADRDVAATGGPLPFFERTTRMTTAPATFARRTGATVLTCTTHRTGLWRGVAIIDPPVEIPHAQDVNTDVLEGTRRIIARLESYIRRDPEQWTVFSDIWPAPEAPEPVGAPG